MHSLEKSIKDNWTTVKFSIMAAAEETVSRGRKKQPEWFEESAELLTPLIAAKNEAYAAYLRSNTQAKKKEFRRNQRTVKKAIDKAKEEWVRRVATQGEEAAKDGRARWMCIRRLQLAHAGRKPTRPQAVMKDNGELTQGPSEVLTGWHQNFNRLLNVESVFSEEVVERITALPPSAELDTTPSKEELVSALSKLKSGKAGGKTDILPELVSCGGVHLFERLLVLMQDVWRREGKVVE